MEYWQKAPVPRDQLVLFATTLEARIPDDHPVRLMDEILAAYDWSAWEAGYHGRRGQPPIPPRVLASVILYGYTRHIRSSRQLEYAVGHNLDFIWLAEGRSLDHSTLCEFRTRFQKPLKDLYRHVCRVAMAMGLVRLNDVALDGTRVLASNHRSRTLTAEKIEKLLAELDGQLERALAHAALADAEDALFDTDDSSTRLPPEVADLQAQQARLKHLLAQAQEADRARHRSADCSGCPPIARRQLPTATRGRSIHRDVHEKRRQQHAAQMATREARERYQKRFHTAEVPFAILKRVLEVRRFLLRGLEQVKTEWLWACTAFNLIKLVRHAAALRAACAASAGAGVASGVRAVF